MYRLVYTNKFKKDVKLLQKRGFDLELLKEVIKKLEHSGTLPEINKSHKLAGNYKGYWEARIKSDWLIIWKIYHSDKEVWLTRTGTHSDLF